MVAIIVLYVVKILREVGVMKWWEVWPVQILPLRAWTWESIRYFSLSTLTATEDLVIKGNLGSCF